MQRPILAAVVIASLAACEAGTTSGEPAPAPTESAIDGAAAPGTPSPDPGASPTTESGEADDSTCGADRLGRWLNLLPTETVRAEIAQTVGHDRIRYIAPGDAVTMDLRPDRLNIETGVDGRIKLFRCG